MLFKQSTMITHHTKMIREFTDNWAPITHRMRILLRVVAVGFTWWLRTRGDMVLVSTSGFHCFRTSDLRPDVLIKRYSDWYVSTNC